MPNQKKKDAVLRIQEKLERATGVYFTDYLGLDVEEMTELRTNCREQNVECMVVKNTLARLSAQNAGLKGIDDVFGGPTFIAFSYDDPVSPARILKRFTETHNLPELKAFVIENQVMDKDSFGKIAGLPTREELYGSLASRLSSPMTTLTLTLRVQPMNLVNILEKLRGEKET